MTELVKRISLRITKNQMKQLEQIISTGQYLKESEILRMALNIGLGKILRDGGVTEKKLKIVGEESKQYGNH